MTISKETKVNFDRFVYSAIGPIYGQCFLNRDLIDSHYDFFVKNGLTPRLLSIFSKISILQSIIEWGGDKTDDTLLAPSLMILEENNFLDISDFILRNDATWKRVIVSSLSILELKLQLHEHTSKVNTVNKEIRLYKVKNLVLDLVSRIQCVLSELYFEEVEFKTDYHLRVVFAGQPNLVKISFIRCYSLNDEILLQITIHCNLLKLLHLCSCPNVSCKGLAAIDRLMALEDLSLAHTNDTGIVTDSLFALWKLPKLSRLNVNGNKRISNVGLNYLLTQDHRGENLVSLNLSGLKYVTDSAIALICVTLPLLQALDIKHCQQISNIGVTAIAKSLKNLRYLNVSGLPLLRDTFSHGMMLVLTLCRELTALSVSRTNTCGKHFVAGLETTNLKSMNMSYVDLKIISKSKRFCWNALQSLTVLRISYCKSLLPGVLLKICKHLPLLQHIAMNGYKTLNDTKFIKVINYLATGHLKCIEIRESSITDHGLMALSKLSKKLQLKKLVLGNGPLITLEGMVYLVMQQTNLQVINLQGSTSISAQEADTFAQYWGGANNSLLLTRTDFHISQRIRKFTIKLLSNIVIIQSFWRMIRSVALRRMKHFQKTRKIAAIKIQNSFRLYKILLLKVEFLLSFRAWKTKIIRIQSHARGQQGRKTRKLKFEQRAFDRKAQSVISIQCLFRQKRSQSILRKLRMHERETQCRRFQAVHFIQRNLRKSMKRKQLHTLELKHLELERLQYAAAKVLQSAFRRKLAYQRIHTIQKVNHLVANIKRFAIKNVIYELALFMKRVYLRRKFKKLVQKAVIGARLVRSIKCHLNKRMLRKKGRIKLTLMRVKASTTCQAIVRMFLCRLSYANFKEEQKKRLNEKKKLEELASNWLYTFVLRRRLLKRIQKKARQDELQKKLYVWACTVLQKCYRGRLGRKEAAKRKKQLACSWKLMCDTSTGSCLFFYHNLRTGKSQWNAPEEVLALLPPIYCSNCEEEMAHIECKDCVEAFCHNCFHLIHSGGKRAFHISRDLYNYYGKRVVYLDNINESSFLWPSHRETCVAIREKLQEQAWDLNEINENVHQDNV